MRLRHIFGALTLAASLSGQTATQQLQVVAIRFWSLAGVTRVAIETNGEFQFKSDRIDNPDRLFFDVIGAAPHLGAKGIIVKQVNDKLLKRVRIAQNVPGGTRVVLDLEGNVEYTASQLESPNRLMIELRAAGSSARAISQVSSPQASPPQVNIRHAEPTLVEPVPFTGSSVASNIQPVDVLPARARLSLATPRPPAPQIALAVPVKPAIALVTAAAPSVIPFPSPAPTAQAKRAATDSTRSLTRALGLKINRVVIDPGHGGHDQGTSGAKGLLEKDLVLDVSLRLGKLIEERMGSEVVYTRADDTFIALEERTALANRRKADLFLSIHANSSPATSVAGIETYYLNFTTSADALDVATRENASSSKTVYELQDLVQTITKHDKIEESREFASSIQSALQALEVKNSPTAKNRGIRKAPFVVLIGAQMPSVLAEIGFLSNPREESVLTKPEGRQKMAEALYRGLSHYTQTLSHFDLPKTASVTPATKPASVQTVEFDK